MAELPSKLKRKTRNSSGSEAESPDGKRICEVSNKEIELSADSNGASRPIIARFLRFPDRERIFRRAIEVRDDTEVRVFTDLPREIQEIRKKQWPKLKKAREEGKLASFDKKEPDKLYIDGHFIPM